MKNGGLRGNLRVYVLCEIQDFLKLTKKAWVDDDVEEEDDDDDMPGISSIIV